MQASALFSGQPGRFGGLSNERELAAACPDQFSTQDNPWTDYATRLYSRGGSIANWTWKSDDETIRTRQLDCLKGLLQTFELRCEDKMAVAGWMLSEMITEVPGEPTT